MAEPLTIGAITAAVTAVLGYGKLQQQVTNNKENIAKAATSKELELVHDSIDGRLDRIENNIEKAINGHG